MTAQRFNWSDTDNPFRVVIPLTYSSPQDGEMMCDTADDDSAGNLILQALLNDVFVLPVLLPEADQCVIDLATQIIEGTAPSLQNLAEFLQGDFEPLILERGDGGFDNLSSELSAGIFILWAANCGLIDIGDFFGE